MTSRSSKIVHHTKQEAQLLQIDRATLRVIKYFVKSLTLIQGHSK